MLSAFCILILVVQALSITLVDDCYNKYHFESHARSFFCDQLEKLHKVDVPENLIKDELSLITQNLKKEDIEKNRKESEKIAIKRIKLGLILNELGEKSNLKVEEQELRNEIQKQVQSMPGQQKQILEYYQKNPAAASSLRGSIYEEKIINLIREKSKKIKKSITSEEATNILKVEHEKRHKHDKNEINVSQDKTHSKKTKKTVKSLENKKKIRKK